MRIDKLLWFLRLAPSRSYGQEWVATGLIRLNGRRVAKPSAAIAPGDVLTLPTRTAVRIVEIVALPQRRGPAPEAQACYRALDERGANPIGQAITPEGNEPP